MAKLACRTCGQEFVQARNPKGGRPAVHCESCRRDPATRTRNNDDPGFKARKQAQRRASREAVDRATTAASEDELVRLAASLSLVSDPVRACDAAGIARTGAEAARLADDARARYGEIVDPTNLAVVGRLARAGIIETLHTLRRRILDVPPGQLANVLRAMESVIASIAATDSAPRYTSITLSVVGPEGQEVRIE